MAYVDFEYYSNEYKGRAIPSAPVFDSLLLRAQAYIDKITCGGIGTADEGVKKAVCAVCEVLQRLDGREGISSENNDGYSVSYVTDEKSFYDSLFAAASVFLPDSLLYRGL